MSAEDYKYIDKADSKIIALFSIPDSIIDNYAFL